jgi:membrane associated rhomboid family serine protease
MVAAQFLLIRNGIDIADWLGLHYWQSSFFKPWQLLTHMFLHGSATDLNLTILHLFSNMFGLWIFGSALENIWGSKRFLIFYILCGLGAAIIHLLILSYGYNNLMDAFNVYQSNPTIDQYQLFLKQYVTEDTGPLAQNLWHFNAIWENDPGLISAKNQSITYIHQYIYGLNYTPQNVYLPGVIDQTTVGASGAVFGVLFAFAYLFPNTLLYIYFFFPIKAKYFIAFYTLFELYAGVKNSAGDNVAHFAHLGGMLVAFIILFIWRRQKKIYRVK